MKILESVVVPHYAGFGMWQEQEFVDTGFPSLRWYQTHIEENFPLALEITDRNLPEIEENGGEDIRGKVYTWQVGSGKKRRYFVIWEEIGGEPFYTSVLRI